MQTIEWVGLLLCAGCFGGFVGAAVSTVLVMRAHRAETMRTRRLDALDRWSRSRSKLISRATVLVRTVRALANSDRDAADFSLRVVKARRARRTWRAAFHATLQFEHELLYLYPSTSIVSLLEPARRHAGRALEIAIRGTDQEATEWIHQLEQYERAGLQPIIDVMTECGHMGEAAYWRSIAGRLIQRIQRNHRRVRNQQGQDRENGDTRSTKRE